LSRAAGRRKEIDMKDWDTLLDDIDGAIMEARNALAEGDLQGLLSAVSMIENVAADLADEVSIARRDPIEDAPE